MEGVPSKILGRATLKRMSICNLSRLNSPFSPRPQYTLFTAPSPLPPPPKKKILLNHCFQFLLVKKIKSSKEKSKTVVLEGRGGGEVNKVHRGHCENSAQGQIRSTFIKAPSRHIPILNGLACVKTSPIPLVARGKVSLYDDALLDFRCAK